MVKIKIIKSKKLKQLIMIKKDSYINFEYFVFYVFKLQSKIFKDLKNCPGCLNVYTTE